MSDERGVLRQIPFGRPWITDAEREAVQEVLAGPVLTHGPQAKAFEAEFAAFVGEPAYCVSVSSGMAALHLACLHFRLGSEDEVIVAAQTHTATAHAVEWVGARPVFVDCDVRTGNVTADRIAAALTPRTRAILLVHYAGIPCDMDEIADLATRHELIVIEDCALAVGARLGGRHVGLFGDAGCFSFYPVKHITTGEGGMLVTRHAEVAAAVGRARAFGVDRAYGERVIPGMYDVPEVGLNYRMSEIAAALGRVQLARLDENLRRRDATFRRLQARLSDLPELTVIDVDRPDAVSGHYCLTVRLLGSLAPRRNEVAARLNETGVGTSVYYPHPVPRLAYYRRKYGYEASAFPNATAISDHSIALPVAPHVTDDDAEYIAERVRTIVGG